MDWDDNIFGGIMRCDVIAEGLVVAFKNLDIKVPVVVRLEGINKEVGRKYLEENGQNIIFSESFEEAAKKIVALVHGA